MAAKPHIFVDNQLSPELAVWIARSFGLQTTHVSVLRPQPRGDEAIARAGAFKGCITLSKDEDFFQILRRRPSPPDLIWLRCGNRSDRLLKVILRNNLPRALELIKSGEHIVEIRDPDIHSRSGHR